MEQYKIDNLVLFDPQEHKLTHISASESATLPLIASQIFSILIEQQGEIVLRETLFTIFDRYGAACTNNNLNQYMLNLRKQLQYIGVQQEVIQTIPRIGFTVPVSIEIEKITKESPLINPTNNPVPQSISRERVSRLLNRTWLAFMFIAIGLSAFFYWHGYANLVTWEKLPKANMILLNEDKSCKLYLINSGLGFKPGEDIDYQYVIKHFNDINCDENVSTRYYLYSSAIRKGKYRKFVLKCTGDSVTRPSCFSRYASVEV